MQIVLSLLIDVNQKKGYLKDNTSYTSLGLNPSTFFLKGYGQLYFNGSLIATGTYGNPFIDLQSGNTGYEFDLETDVNGEVATGVYSVNYYVESQRSSVLTSCDATTIYVNYNTAYNSNLWSNPGDIAINISGTGGTRTLTYGQIVSVNDAPGDDIGFEGNVPLLTLAQNTRNVTLQFRTLNVAFVYTGCTKVTQDIGFTYDCDTDPTGSWSVYSNTPTPSGVTVGAATGTIEWPSWTGEPNINVLSLPYSNTALATGTYGATISQVVTQVIQSSPLLEIEYTLTDTYEWKVTCAGSLCELNACIESLRAAHEAELLRNKISKYQPYVDNVAIYLHEAQNYKSCGEFDKYRETLAKVKSNLDASGCDCGCCDDNEYKWVAVSPATSTFINNIMSEIQFRVGTTANRPTTTISKAGNGLVTGAIYHSTTDGKLYEAAVFGNSITWTSYYDPSLSYISTATNGLTENPAGTVKLGGTLTADTTIGLGSHDLTIESSTGTTIIAKDATGSASSTFALNIMGQFPVAPTLGGVGFSFVTQEPNTTVKEVGTITSVWTSYSTESKMLFSVQGGGSKPTAKLVIYGATGIIEGVDYGQGNLLENGVDYLLGVNSSGEFKEVDPLTVIAVTGAANGLSLVNKNAELGGTLTKNTTITTGNNFFNVIGQTRFENTNGVTSTDVNIVGTGGGLVYSTLNFSAASSSGGTTYPFAKIISPVIANNAGRLGDGILSFELFSQNGSAKTPLQLFADGKVRIAEYVSNTFADNNPNFLLGLDASGFVKTVPLPLVYIAKLTQSGNAPPVATVISDTISLSTPGTTLTWARNNNPGQYVLNATNPVFTLNKTYISVTPSLAPASILGAQANANNQCSLTSWSITAGTYADNMMVAGAFIKIEVYP